MTKAEMNMHRINLCAVAAYLSGKQEEPDDAPSQHMVAVNRALKDLEKTNSELEEVRAYNAVLLAVAEANKMIYGDHAIVGELVRCKDCKQSGIDSTSCPQYWCSAHTEYHDGDWFCADGERREVK